MTPDRTLLCYMIAVATAFATAFGTQLLAGIATGDPARAFPRAGRSGPYWLVALPVCYLVAGVLGYLGRCAPGAGSSPCWRSTRSTPSLSAGSGLSLWPLALVMYLVISLPGIVTGWLGGLLRRRRDAAAQAATEPLAASRRPARSPHRSL